MNKNYRDIKPKNSRLLDEGIAHGAGEAKNHVAKIHLADALGLAAHEQGQLR